MKNDFQKLRHIIRVKNHISKQPLFQDNVWNQTFTHYSTITELWAIQCRQVNILPINNPDHNFYKSCMLILQDKITRLQTFNKHKF